MFTETELAFLTGDVWTGRKWAGDRFRNLLSGFHINFGDRARRLVQANRLFRYYWEKHLETGDLFPAEIVAEVIGTEIQEALSRGRKLVLSDAPATVEQLNLLTKMVGQERIRRAVAVFFRADEHVCIERGLKNGYSEKYVLNRIKQHRAHLQPLEEALRDQVDLVIEVDGNKCCQDEIWRQIMDQFVCPLAAG